MIPEVEDEQNRKVVYLFQIQPSSVEGPQMGDNSGS